MILGFDYLGGAKFQSAMLSAHKRGLAAGIFLRTFGDARKTLEAMCKRGTFSEIVVHLAPFDGSHQYLVSKYLTQLIDDARFCETLQQKYHATKLLISPFCEHKHSAATMKGVFDKVKAVAPSCLLVNSIIKGGARVPGIPCELHLENEGAGLRWAKSVFKTGDLISFDGFGGKGEGDFADCNFETIAAAFTTARHIRGWAFRCNGKFGHKDKAAVNARKHWPSKEYLQGHLATMEKREGALWSNEKLLKPFADDHGQGGKDNKLMLLYKKKQPQIKVLDSKGKHIDTLYRTKLGDYSGSGPLKGHARYYSKRYAIEVAQIAKKNTGSNLVKIENEPLIDVRKRSNAK